MLVHAAEEEQILQLAHDEAGLFLQFAARRVLGRLFPAYRSTGQRPARTLASDEQYFPVAVANDGGPFSHRLCKSCDAAFVIERPLASGVPRRFGQSGSREALHIGMSVLQRCAKAMDRGIRLLL
jgi:hypothetical protein